MRAVLFGLAAGVTLSLARAPAGYDLFELAAPSAWTRYGARALGLAAIALGTAGRGRRGGSGETCALLAGAFAGFALHGLLLADAVGFASATGLGLGACALALALRALRPKAPHPHEGEVEVEPAERGPGWPALAGLALAGAGLALGLEGAARYGRLLSDGPRHDATGFALVFLALAAIGAGAFGHLVARPALASAAFPAGLAACASGALASLSVVGRLASPRGLSAYFRHPLTELSGVDPSRHGSLPYDLLVGGSCFVLPAMLLGTALCAARRRAELAAALLGAAAGPLLVPLLVPAQGVEAAAAERAGPLSPALCALGIHLAAGGAAAALVLGRGARAARAAALAVALAAGLLPLTLRPAPAAPLAPWSRIPARARALIETPEGVLAVEDRGDGFEAVTLDRRPLAPDRARAPADAARLARSMRLAPAFARARNEVRVLLVGQLTPGRALALRELGAARIDRSGSWWRAMGALEERLFGERELPAGEVVAPAEARRRCAAGGYDLVLALPPGGCAPRAPGDLCAGRWIDLPPGAAAVLWLDAAWPADHADLGPRVLLAADGIAGLSLAVVCGAGEDRTEGLLFAPAGRPRRWRPPLVYMLPREEERGYLSLERMGRRLAGAARGGELEHLTAGLAALYSAQRRSSPYEDPVARVELPREALESLRADALARPLDAFTRELWEQIARVLVGKRWVPEILELCEPLARHHAPWPALQGALAHAALESLDPAAALAWLEGVPELTPDDRNLWVRLGEAHRMLGDHTRSAAALRRARALDPDDLELRRALAIELVLAGDPEGQVLLEEILAANPEDELLQQYRGPGPYPEPDPGFRPHLFGRTREL